MHPLKTWLADTKKKDADLADLVGVSRVQIYRIREGQNRPSLKTARKLEAVTKIPAAELMTWEAA
jgi:transcriptional regulator with XRE-family HTH domain